MSTNRAGDGADCCYRRRVSDRARKCVVRLVTGETPLNANALSVYEYNPSKQGHYFMQVNKKKKINRSSSIRVLINEFYINVIVRYFLQIDNEQNFSILYIEIQEIYEFFAIKMFPYVNPPIKKKKKFQQ